MKTNILQFIGSFHSGGSERQAVQLVRLLSGEKNCRVFVACLNKEGVLRPEVEQLGFTDFPEFPLTSFYDVNFLRQLRRCADFLRENQIEIIQSSDFYTNVFGMLAGTVARTPVRIAAKRETGMRSRAQGFVEQRAFNLSHSIVVNAEAVKKYLVERGNPADKITTIYNGLNLERLNPSLNRVETLAEFNLPDEEGVQFVTIIANFRSEVKNQRMFLQAAKRVKEKIPGARFVLAGEGELLTEMKNLARELNLESETFFTGRCERIAELLSISNVCVLSSKSEGFSNSILEYMAAGKPVVATRVGGASEAIVENETGFLVASDDDEALANRLIVILSDREKAEKMGKRATQIVEEKFSTAAQLENTLRLYERLLSAKRVFSKTTRLTENKGEELVK